MALVKHIPNTITSMNLLAGIMGVIFTLEGRPDIAFPLMILAAVFDFCDGLAARLLNAYSPIGKELDSLSDLVSFGVLPSLMLYKTMDGAPVWMRYIPLFIALMSALRLAKFNVDERQTSDFIGLPTPACAMVCGSMAFLLYRNGAVPMKTQGMVAVMSILLGLLLVSEIPMFGMKIKKGHRLLDAKRYSFLIISAALLIMTLVRAKNWAYFVCGVFLAYILVNLYIWIVTLFKRTSKTKSL